MPVWKEISEYTYNDALKVLPPTLLSAGAFLVGEPTDHCAEGPRFAAYLQKEGRFWHLSEPITRADMLKIVKGALAYDFDDTPLPDVKVRALAAHFGVSPETINEERGENLYSCDSEPGEYWVLTDEEADEAWDQDLENYLDEYVLGELPEVAQRYFDREAWKEDARHDGRAHSLGRYDGNEHEVKLDGEWFYIYRVN